MKNKPPMSKDPDLIASAAALCRAARRALRLGLQTGTPVYALVDGQIVDLTERHRKTKASSSRRSARTARPATR